MIRTFRIFQLAKREPLSESEMRKRLNAVKMAASLQLARPPLARSLAVLAGRLTGERLHVSGLNPRRWELVLTGKWPSRVITVATGSPPPVPIQVSVWVRRTVPWVIVFEANRGLSEAAARLVATAVAGDPSMVDPLTPDLPHWQALEEWAEQKGTGSGAILGGRFYHARPADTPVEWIALRCASASDRKLLRECMKTSTGIGELLIRTRSLKPLRESLLCRIGRYGGIRVYGDDILDEAIEALLFELQVIWGFIPRLHP